MHEHNEHEKIILQEIKNQLEAASEFASEDEAKAAESLINRTAEELLKRLHSAELPRAAQPENEGVFGRNESDDALLQDVKGHLEAVNTADGPDSVNAAKEALFITLRALLRRLHEQEMAIAALRGIIRRACRSIDTEVEAVLIRYGIDARKGET